MARDEGATEDADEEADSIETTGIGDSTRAEGRYCTGDQTPGECIARPEAITARSSDESDDEGSAQTDDVAVEDLWCCEMDILLDDVVQKRRECIPVSG